MNTQRPGQAFKLTFDVYPTPSELLTRKSFSFSPENSGVNFTELSGVMRDCKPRVAVLRQEGTNGDREMCSAFYSGKKFISFLFLYLYQKYLVI